VQDWLIHVPAIKLGPRFQQVSISITIYVVAVLSKDVQDLSHRLHSSKLDFLGIAVAARSFCKELSEKQKVVVEFSHEGVPGSLPNEVSHCLFRVLQEALQNAVKYSGVQTFRMELRGASSEIQLTVSDCGVDFDQQEAMNRQGLGLISMRERLQLVNGYFFIDSKPGFGTTVKARNTLRSESASTMNAASQPYPFARGA
jgi:signal transduction histidine kinase